MDRLELDKKLLDYLSGDADLFLRGEIEQWLGEDASHRQYFAEYQKKFLYARWAFRQQLISHDNFGGLQARIRKRLFWHRMQMAAIIVLFLGIGGLFWWTSTGDRQKVVLVKKEKESLQKSNAILILSEGTEIPLKARATEIKEQDGSRIRVDDKGQVLYNKIEYAEKLVFNRLIVPRGGEYAVVLSDNTKVWLNADSELKYPVHFTKNQRTVFLKGEAYFEVTSDTKSPFVICTENQIQVTVYGTKFLVNTYRQNLVETVLVEGKVGIKAAKEKEYFLEPCERALYDTELKQATVDKVDIEPYISWVYGNFVFRNEPLESIMEKLSRWYDLDVFFTSEEIKKIRLSGDMERFADIQDFLFFFEQVSKLHFEIKGKIIVISK